MIDILDKSRAPDEAQLREYAACPLLDQLCLHMDGRYAALRKIEYSSDAAQPGWNLKFKKAGRTLCTVYPRRGGFAMLLVVGRREKARVEAMLPFFSEGFRALYSGTPEGMGQRWLMIDPEKMPALYGDALRVIDVRRQAEENRKGG